MCGGALHFPLLKRFIRVTMFSVVNTYKINYCILCYRSRSRSGSPVAKRLVTEECYIWSSDDVPLVFEVWGSDVPLVFEVWGSDVPLVFEV